MKKIALIAGAGPAGLTSALELLTRSDVVPLVMEADTQVGGISKTVQYRGNRMDIGGHRFFSKSDWVMNWWQNILPVAADELADGEAVSLGYQGQRADFSANRPSPAQGMQTMIVRSRLSRIYYRRRFFDYPLKLSWNTLKNLGPAYVAAIGASYAAARVWPRRPEQTLEDFFYNRFGNQLYRTFFKDYTEKVWGVPCSEISAEWGAQRIKGLSITRALAHALRAPFRSGTDTRQKGTETSLIERFLYPRLGPGQMWEEVARRVNAAGGEVRMEHRIVALHRDGRRVIAADVRDAKTGNVSRVECDYFISTMPVKDLCALLQPSEPEVVRIAGALPYRDFMTAGVLVSRMRPTGSGTAANHMPPDNWIYIQEPDVKLGRLQVFNNWSPHLVADPSTIWLGLEYFCAEGDALWSTPDASFLDLATRELEKIGLIDRADVLDGTVVRVPKAYPAYFGEYRGIGRVRAFLDEWQNVFPVGRNGMHRYNNQDHSMLAARAAVDCILGGSADKAGIWSVNAEEEYHETTATPATAAQPEAGVTRHVTL
jgi:protoporphyrinogen oxidase